MYLAFQLNQLGNNDKNYFNHLYFIHTHIYILLYMSYNMPTHTVIIFKSIAHANIASLLAYYCGELYGAQTLGTYFAKKFITPQHLGTYIPIYIICDIFNIAVIRHLSLAIVSGLI